MDKPLRIIPVLFIKNGLIVRSKNFNFHQVIGNIIEQAKRLSNWNVDELIYIDITRNEKYDLGRDDLSIKSFDNIKDIIEEANNIANSSRKGPVHIDLPKDILSKNSKYSFEYKKNLNNSSFDAFDSKIIKSNILVKYNQIKELLKKDKYFK